VNISIWLSSNIRFSAQLQWYDICPDAFVVVVIVVVLCYM